MILSNSNGLYPQGFQTPGIVRQWQQANGGAVNGVGSQADSRKNSSQFSLWFQDDWRTTPRLTLNLGVRYDLDINLWDQENLPNNATRLALEAIGHPQAEMPKTPYKNISPRVGFAYDLAGDGRRVLRGGYGLYFDQFNQQPFGDISSQNHRPLNVVSTLINTAIGVGQLANYRFGIDPLPAQPTDGSALPPGSLGQWIGSDVVDPRVHHMHIGYAHELGAATMFSVDYTHQEGTTRAHRVEHQSHRQRRAGAGPGLPPRLRAGQRAQPDQRQVVDRRVPGRHAHLQVPAAPAAHDDSGALHAGGGVCVWRLDRGARRDDGAAAGLVRSARAGRVGADAPGRASPRGGHGRVRAPVRHPALARVPGGERPPLQPDGRHRPEPGRDPTTIAGSIRRPASRSR